MSNPQNKPAGFLPDQLVKGGLKTDFNAEITDALWDFYTFKGKDGNTGATSFGLHLHFTDEEGQADEQFYSAGKETEWAPSADKSQPIPSVEGRGLNESSNYAAFIRSIIFDCGVPASKLSSVKDLIGGSFFFTRVAQQERQGLENEDGKKRTVLVAKKCNRLPWDAKKTAGAGAGGKKERAKSNASEGAAASSGSGESDNPDAEAVKEILVDLLSTGDFPDGMPLKAVMPRLMKDKVLDQEKYKPRKAAITKAILNAEVLGSLAGISYQGGIINFG